MTLDIGRVGVWTPSSAWDDADDPGAAAELEELGFGTIWLGVADGDLRLPRALLAASSSVVVATSIVSIWSIYAHELAANAHAIEQAHPGRFLLGLGNSHEVFVSAMGHSYDRPLTRFAEYLDQLDAAPHPVPADRRVLAALGPKALTLAARRAAGAHPYLVTPEHTAAARERIGGALLAPEHKVILDADAGAARRAARAHLAFYLTLPNYVRNLRGYGFTDGDFADGGSDRLVDALYAWGDPDRVAELVSAHHRAGADHVAVQVIGAEQGKLPREQWRTIAGALGL